MLTVYSQCLLRDFASKNIISKKNCLVDKELNYLANNVY